MYIFLAKEQFYFLIEFKTIHHRWYVALSSLLFSFFFFGNGRVFGIFYDSLLLLLFLVIFVRHIWKTRQSFFLVCVLFSNFCCLLFFLAWNGQNRISTAKNFNFIANHTFHNSFHWKLITNEQTNLSMHETHARTHIFAQWEHANQHRYVIEKRTQKSSLSVCVYASVYQETKVST